MSLLHFKRLGGMADSMALEESIVSMIFPISISEALTKLKPDGKLQFGLISIILWRLYDIGYKRSFVLLKLG